MFHETALAADIPETTRLAETVDRWRPDILGSLETGLTNARTGGHNRIIEQVERLDRGYPQPARLAAPYPLHVAARTAA